MDKKTPLEKIMADIMRKTRKELANEEHKWIMVKALNNSSEWQWDAKFLCWNCSSETSNVQATIYYSDIETGPGLSAGFASFHDPTFEKFEWAVQSPYWSGQFFPTVKSRLSDLSEDTIERLLHDSPWNVDGLD